MRPFLAMAILLGAAASDGAAMAQSFNCARASYADEHRICREPVLSRLDEELAEAYGRAMRRLSRREAARLDREEEAWVVARRRCGADDRCIERAYRDRIGELAAIAGPSLPEPPSRPAMAARPAEPPSSPASRPEPAERPAASGEPERPAAAPVPLRPERAAAAGKPERTGAAAKKSGSTSAPRAAAPEAIDFPPAQ